ncbi:hypothetical protein GOP47_0020214 [Adiantum capillus-veneris]|uniref:Uncharacterized protein n=1 Tax=Adiantum capillus-veneris TaxID=13818 RepID=A0A9D4UDX3_ADICA|nr:hypothetical protein GOP47_0020214 [Adiantum capillus-veneris]
MYALLKGGVQLGHALAPQYLSFLTSNPPPPPPPPLPFSLSLSLSLSHTHTHTHTHTHIHTLQSLDVSCSKDCRVSKATIFLISTLGNLGRSMGQQWILSQVSCIC